MHDDDLEWDVDHFRLKGVPEMSKNTAELAFAAYNNVPPGMEPELEAVSYYAPRAHCRLKIYPLKHDRASFETAAEPFLAPREVRTLGASSPAPLRRA